MKVKMRDQLSQSLRTLYEFQPMLKKHLKEMIKISGRGGNSSYLTDETLKSNFRSGDANVVNCLKYFEHSYDTLTQWQSCVWSLSVPLISGIASLNSINIYNLYGLEERKSYFNFLFHFETVDR